MASKKYLNPFKPTAGAEPPVLIGRDDVLRDFEDGLEQGVGAPARLMRITGARGSGKTVLLTQLGDIAREQGWLVVDVTASPAESLPDAIVSRLKAKRRIKSVKAGVSAVVASADVELGLGGQANRGLREVLDEAVGKLVPKGLGLLVTVDEVQDASEDDVRQIAVAVQYLIREKKNIAFVFAGITTGVMSLLNGEGMTFLRRAKPEELGTIAVAEVERALRETIEEGGLSIDDDALHAAAEATYGYAYLVQLVGYNIWYAARKHVGESTVMSMGDVALGISLARKDFEAAVLETAISDLPRTAMEYLMAMSQDTAASSTGEIADRLGVKATSLSGARQLLIARQVIEPTARGYVGFSIPLLREYLIQNKPAIMARYGVVVKDI